MRTFKLKFRVWHVAQVPGKPFYVEVPTLHEAERLKNALADYDLFQLNNNIKPDYCNASGIQFFDHTLTDEDMADLEMTDRWVDVDTPDFHQTVDEFNQRGIDVYYPLPPEVLEKAAEVILNSPGDEICDPGNAEKIAAKIYTSINLHLSENEDE